MGSRDEKREIDVSVSAAQFMLRVELLYFRPGTHTTRGADRWRVGFLEQRVCVRLELAVWHGPQSCCWLFNVAWSGDLMLWVHGLYLNLFYLNLYVLPNDWD